MGQLIEFAGNHMLMVTAFVGTLLMLIYTEVSRANQGFNTISTHDAVSLINNDNAAVVDVSNADVYRKAHIAGAWHLPLAQLKNPGKDIEKLKDRPIIVVCKSGTTAQTAASSLVKQGYASVSLLRGGMTQWLSDHLPVKNS